MALNESAIELAVRRVERAAEQTIADGRMHLINGEVPFTSRLLTRIQDSLQGYNAGGIQWSAHEFSTHQGRLVESSVGADFLGVLRVDTPSLRLSKGFLAQSKLLENDARMNNAEFVRLQGQCRKMLIFSPDSYVVLYGSDSIRTVAASHVVGTTDRILDRLAPTLIGDFYGEHFRCNVGDRLIDEPNPRVLARALHGAEPSYLYLLATDSHA